MTCCDLDKDGLRIETVDSLILHKCKLLGFQEPLSMGGIGRLLSFLVNYQNVTCLPCCIAEHTLSDIVFNSEVRCFFVFF